MHFTATRVPDFLFTSDADMRTEDERVTTILEPFTLTDTARQSLYEDPITRGRVIVYTKSPEYFSPVSTRLTVAARFTRDVPGFGNVEHHWV